MEGDVKRGSFMAGQCAGMIDDVRCVADIIVEMVAEAEEILLSMPSLVVR